MSERTRLKYYGWSSFGIESTSGNLLFDPLYRELFGNTWATLEDFKKTQVICVTHGHYDHYIDVHRILEKTEAVVVASSEVCRHLHLKYGVKKERLRPIRPFEEKEVSGYTITAFEWGHREVKISKFLKAGLLKLEVLPTLQFAWLNLFKVPFTAPFFGYSIEGPDKIRIMNYCEGFSDTMEIEKVRGLGQRFKPDVLIAGMQLNFEEQLSKGVAALSAKRVFLFSPHGVMFEKLGMKSSPAANFVSGIKRELPGAEVMIAEPKESYVL
jgi:hypothetical protein